MSREIKFRGICTETNQFVYGDLVHDFVGVGSKRIEVGIRKAGYYPVDVIAETVGELTGLHDRNGKEIYEGDVVNITIGSGFQKMSINGVTEYEVQACAFWIKWKDGNVSRYHEMRADSGGDYFQSSHYEVIGNIHQNPELLK